MLQRSEAPHQAIVLLELQAPAVPPDITLLAEAVRAAHAFGMRERFVRFRDADPPHSFRVLVPEPREFMSARSQSGPRPGATRFE